MGKYVKYKEKISNHISYLNKYIISGDDIVDGELKKEVEILKKLKIYDGVNEFHTGYNEDRAYGELERIRWDQGYKSDKNDFEDEFNDIHDEIEGLIANDEEIIHQKLRDKQLSFARKRKELRERRKIERERLNGGKITDGDDEGNIDDNDETSSLEQ